MALPIQHPFWAELILVCLVTGFTAIWVYAWAGRFTNPETISALGLVRVRRESALAAAFLALVVGLAASVVYLRWAAVSPEFAARMFLIGGIACGIVFSASAVVLSARQRMRGSRAMIALNLVWAVTYGYVLPKAAVWWAGG